MRKEKKINAWGNKLRRGWGFARFWAGLGLSPFASVLKMIKSAQRLNGNRINWKSFSISVLLSIPLVLIISSPTQAADNLIYGGFDIAEAPPITLSPDINNDGLIDAIVPNFNLSQNNPGDKVKTYDIYLNDGTGKFNFASSIYEEKSARSHTGRCGTVKEEFMADINGDGLVDFVPRCAFFPGGKSKYPYYINLGGGKFVPHYADFDILEPTTERIFVVRSVGVQDLNQDGKTDLIIRVAHDDADGDLGRDKIATFFNTGNGNLTLHKTFFLETVGAETRIGNFDSNPGPDLVVVGNKYKSSSPYSSLSDGLIMLFSNDGHGNFDNRPSSAVVKGARFTREPIVIDIDGDGKDEVGIFDNPISDYANDGIKPTLRFFSLGSGWWNPWKQKSAISVDKARPLIVIDTNGSGKDDIVWFKDSRIVITLNDGSGNFSFGSGDFLSPRKNIRLGMWQNAEGVEYAQFGKIDKKGKQGVYLLFRDFDVSNATLFTREPLDYNTPFPGAQIVDSQTPPTAIPLTYENGTINDAKSVEVDSQGRVIVLDYYPTTKYLKIFSPDGQLQKGLLLEQVDIHHKKHLGSSGMTIDAKDNIYITYSSGKEESGVNYEVYDKDLNLLSSVKVNSNIYWKKYGFGENWQAVEFELGGRCVPKPNGEKEGIICVGHNSLSLLTKGGVLSMPVPLAPEVTVSERWYRSRGAWQRLREVITNGTWDIASTGKKIFALIHSGKYINGTYHPDNADRVFDNGARMIRFSRDFALYPPIRYINGSIYFIADDIHKQPYLVKLSDSGEVQDAKLLQRGRDYYNSIYFRGIDYSSIGFSYEYQFDIDSSGNLYVLNRKSSKGKILKFDSRGRRVDFITYSPSPEKVSSANATWLDAKHSTASKPKGLGTALLQKVGVLKDKYLYAPTGDEHAIYLSWNEKAQVAVYRNGALVKRVPKPTDYFYDYSADLSADNKYEIKVVDRNGAEKPKATTVIIKSPLIEVSNLQARRHSPVRLDWSLPADIVVSKFLIYRSNQQGVLGDEIFTGALEATGADPLDTSQLQYSYQDTTSRYNERYYYTVKTQVGDWISRGKSIEVPALAKVSDLTGVILNGVQARLLYPQEKIEKSQLADDARAVFLSWREAVPVQIERALAPESASPASADYKVIATIQNDISSYFDYSADATRDYSYRVKILNNAGAPYSEPTSVSVKGSPDPQVIRAKEALASVDIKWVSGGSQPSSETAPLIGRHTNQQGPAKGTQEVRIGFIALDENTTIKVSNPVTGASQSASATDHIYLDNQVVAPDATSQTTLKLEALNSAGEVLTSKEIVIPQAPPPLTTTAKARDNQRLADLETIYQALRDFHRQEGYLPTVESYRESGRGSWDYSFTDNNGNGKKFLDFLEEKGYLDKVPLDPLNDGEGDAAYPNYATSGGKGHGYFYYCYPEGELSLGATVEDPDYVDKKAPPEARPYNARESTLSFDKTWSQYRFWKVSRESGYNCQSYGWEKPAPKPEAVLNYNFDEQTGGIVKDSSGKLNDATINGDVRFIGASDSIAGQALYFDGKPKKDYLAIANSPSLQVESGLTIATWVKPEKQVFNITSGNHEFVDKGHDFVLRLNGLNGGKFATFVRRGSRYGVGERFADNVQSKTKWQPGNWYHVVSTYKQGEGIRLYVNGKLEASDNSYTGALNASDRELAIGSAFNHGRTFKGALDELRILNYPLTDAQVDELYQPQLPKAESVKGLNGYWITSENVGQADEDAGLALNAGEKAVRLSWESETDADIYRDNTKVATLTKEKVFYDTDASDSDHSYIVVVHRSGIDTDIKDLSGLVVKKPGATLDLSIGAGDNTQVTDKINAQLKITLEGDAKVVSTDSGANKVIVFDGDGDFLSVSADAQLDFTRSWTVSALVNQSPESYVGEEFAKRNFSLVSQDVLDNDSTGAFNIYLRPDEQGSSLQYETNNQSSGVDGLASPEDKTLQGKWRTLSVSFAKDASPSLRLYIDGKQVASGNPPAPVKTWGGLFVGRRGIGNFFKGKLAGLQVYNYALSADEIEQINNDSPFADTPQTRDAKRLADLDIIYKALKDFHKREGYLPIPHTYGENAQNYGQWDYSWQDKDGDGKKFLDFLEEKGYLDKVPIDPLNDAKDTDLVKRGDGYSYFYYCYGEGGGPDGQGVDIKDHYNKLALGARLENPKGQKIKVDKRKIFWKEFGGNYNCNDWRLYESEAQIFSNLSAYWVTAPSTPQGEQPSLLQSAGGKLGPKGSGKAVRLSWSKTADAVVYRDGVNIGAVKQSKVFYDTQASPDQDHTYAVSLPRAEGFEVNISELPSVGIEKQGLMLDAGFELINDKLVVDSSGRANNALLTGGVDCQVNGAQGKACALNGTDGKLDISALSGKHSQVSIAFWIKIDDAPDASGIASIFDLAGNPGVSGAIKQLSLGFNKNDKKLLLTLVAPAGNQENQGETTKQIQLDLQSPMPGFAHFAVVFDGGDKLKLYQNGKLADSVNIPETQFIDFSNTMKIIGANTGQKSYLQGTIDQLKIYNLALPKKDIYDLYDSENPEKLVTRKVSNLVGKWINASSTLPTEATPDGAEPSALTGPVNGSTAVRLAWDESVKARIYRDGQAIGEVSFTDHFFDHSADPKENYTYKVKVIFRGSELEEASEVVVKGYEQVVPAKITCSFNKDDPALVSAFTFDEGLVGDLVAGRPDIITQGVSYQTGFSGRAINLDGKGFGVYLPSSQDLNLPDHFTLSVWVKPSADDLKTNKTIIGKPDLPSQPAKLAPYNLYLMPYSKRGQVAFSVGGYGALISDETIKADSWSQISAVFNKDDAIPLKLYINGALATPIVSPKGKGPQTFNSSGVTLGAWYQPAGIERGSRKSLTNAYSGALDEVRVYQSALSKDKIASAYRKCVGKEIELPPTLTLEATWARELSWQNDETASSFEVYATDKLNVLGRKLAVINDESGTVYYDTATKISKPTIYTVVAKDASGNEISRSQTAIAGWDDPPVDPEQLAQLANPLKLVVKLGLEIPLAGVAGADQWKMQIIRQAKKQTDVLQEIKYQNQDNLFIQTPAFETNQYFLKWLPEQGNDRKSFQQTIHYKELIKPVEKPATEDPVVIASDKFTPIVVSSGGVIIDLPPIIPPTQPKKFVNVVGVAPDKDGKHFGVLTARSHLEFFRVDEKGNVSDGTLIAPLALALDKSTASWQRSDILKQDSRGRWQVAYPDNGKIYYAISDDSTGTQWSQPTVLSGASSAGDTNQRSAWNISLVASSSTPKIFAPQFKNSTTSLGSWRVNKVPAKATVDKSKPLSGDDQRLIEEKRKEIEEKLKKGKINPTQNQEKKKEDAETSNQQKETDKQANKTTEKTGKKENQVKGVSISSEGVLSAQVQNLLSDTTIRRGSQIAKDNLSWQVAGHIHQMSSVIDSQGTVHSVYLLNQSDDPHARPSDIYYRKITSDGVIEQEQITNTGKADLPRIVIDSLDTITIFGWDNSENIGGIFYTSGSYQNWSAKKIIIANGMDEGQVGAVGLDATIDKDGSLYIVWSGRDNAVHYSKKVTSGTFSAPALVLSVDDASKVAPKSATNSLATLVDSTLIIINNDKTVVANPNLCSAKNPDHYQLFVDDKPVAKAQTLDELFPLENLEAGKTYTIYYRTYWCDGSFTTSNNQIVTVPPDITPKPIVTGGSEPVINSALPPTLGKGDGTTKFPAGATTATAVAVSVIAVGVAVASSSASGASSLIALKTATSVAQSVSSAQASAGVGTIAQGVATVAQSAGNAIGPILQMAGLRLPFIPALPGKKRRPWSIVIDEESKKPIQKARVKLYSRQTKRLVATTLTDEQGRFSFLMAKEGEYYIVVESTGFATLKTEAFSARKSGFTDLPSTLKMTIVKVWQKPSDSFIHKLWRKTERILTKLRRPLLLLGTISVVYNLIIYHGLLEYLLLGLYLLLWIWEIKNARKPRSYGKVLDKETHIALPASIVRAWRIESGGMHLAGTAVSDQAGKYQMLLSPGTYRFSVDRIGYETFYSSNQLLRGKATLPSLDFRLEKHKTKSKPSGAHSTLRYSNY